MNDLLTRTCAPCAPGTPPLGEARVQALLATVPGWQLNGTEIVKTFEFKNFHQTMAFVNAVAWIANRENHHPDLEVGYKRCKIRYATHSIGGLSENDFICAAKINALQD
ncbi:MAG: 4a-hydroxytetrahydrobiopterin dehydratase [bacterium]